MALAVLGDDAETCKGAFLAGDVEGRVPAVVDQPRVGAGLQEPLDQLGLFCDHCEVKGRLGRRSPFISIATLKRRFDHVIGMNKYLSLVVLRVEEGVLVRQFDHLMGMLCGFMNDGQVEKPARQKKGGNWLLPFFLLTWAKEAKEIVPAE